MKFADFFTTDNRFEFIEAVKAGEEPWSILWSMGSLMNDFFSNRARQSPDKFFDLISVNHAALPAGHGEDWSILVRVSTHTSGPVCIPERKIFIAAGVFLEAGAMIKGPCIIGQDCEIRHGAYIRGGVIVGKGCVVGHATEMKNSIIMDHSNAGHFNYLGDSVVGSRANLGAGSILANLKFRQREEIISGEIKKIRTTGHKGNRVDTGVSKLGAVIGDFSEVGCNTVALPGALVGSDCWIYPNTTLPRGVYPSGSIIKNRGALEVDVAKRDL
ncbi:MAG: UDP-N-acetylglucosamine diphosphorylase [Nitrospinota bacterium]|nr:UDP-N-acetylglucosamine diphosphorylase [Nitrospinota bacterium]